MSCYGACRMCKHDIADSDRYVVCEGFCLNSACHTKCVDVTDDECDACGHENIFWMCNDCRDYMQSYKFRNIVNAMRTEESKVDRLSAEVCELRDTVKCLIDSVKIPSPEIPSPASSVKLSNHGENSPLSSTKMNLTQKRQNMDHSNVPSVGANNSESARFKLFLSNIANDVTETEIEQMVCGVLGTNHTLRVKRLVPPWKNVSSMDYVSFKVEMDASFKSTALSSENWPVNVRRREFKEHSNEVWRPTNRSCLY